MSQSKSVSLLNQLLQQDAFYVRTWLKDTWSGQLKAPERFNWLGLAEAAAFRAHHASCDDDNASDLCWAEVAMSVYDQRAEVASVDARESDLLSSMTLRAAMIARLGSVPGHPVLDLNRIISWFFDNLTMSRQEAETKAAFWMKCPGDDIRELRRIKNRLNVISVLAESDRFIPSEELSAWLSLRKKLP